MNEEGEEVQEWVTTKNMQFKHLNLCMNNCDDDIEKPLLELLMRTPEDFGVTLSSNKMTEEIIEKLHSKITASH